MSRAHCALPKPHCAVLTVVSRIFTQSAEIFSALNVMCQLAEG
jgi:hypothetical protein